MRTRGKFVLAIMSAVTLFVALAEPAEARRRIRFGSFGGFGGGSGYAEKIDKVYDLPDTGSYFHDGKYYDLGAFYTIRDGAEIYPAEPSFVLYNGDRYVKLGGAELTMLTAELGMDPTATYRASYAAKVTPRPKSAAEIDRRDGESMAEFRARVRGMAHGQTADRSGVEGATAPSSARVGGTWLGVFFLPMLFIGVIFLFGVRKFLRRRTAAVLAAAPEELPATRETGSFDQRIAARLRELEGGPGQAASAPAAPAARTFGRKVA
ncbi:hypothetical protein MZO42_12145 [Sphingomonas psychrotolerans]|uniref:Uncharacterized protein n=1 Tax=Sphingomonas psychrotolerans TaxID=1327635 RepID=A0ABU3N4I0_9SPHN|nr:hypothetical protein [Sphingomonas psychrotolerans]MDT8759447.1 hypothetical protein [Sphingomonas psychrotolerans]